MTVINGIGLGCHQPPQGHVGGLSFRMSDVVKMTAATPSVYDMRDNGFVPTVKDQDGTSSCTGHGSSTLIETSFAAQGTPLDFTPSEGDIYRVGREVERARMTPLGLELPALLDNGAYPHDVMMGLNQFGIRPRREVVGGRNSDVDPFTINDDQKLGDLQEASSRIITGQYVIDHQASDGIAQARVALSHGIPLGVAFYVDQAFMYWNKSKPPCSTPDLSTNGGGHWIAVVGYMTINGKTVFILRNSWGTGSGDEGDWLVDEAWFRAAWVVYAMDTSFR